MCVSCVSLCLTVIVVKLSCLMFIIVWQISSGTCFGLIYATKVCPLSGQDFLEQNRSNHSGWNHAAPQMCAQFLGTLLGCTFRGKSVPPHVRQQCVQMMMRVGLSMLVFRFFHAQVGCQDC